MLLALVTPAVGAVPLQASAPPRPPALVVVISVDQLRADLLQRYDRFFTGGFRRLRDEGAGFTAMHDHAGSETGPGHATISTGVAPARNGIVANSWYERVGDRWVGVYNVADSLSPIVGLPDEPGRSPRNLLRTGLADWIQARDPRARVVSISGKDRGAILLAGKTRGDVYWFDQQHGRFVTSRHYTDRVPAWVESFNRGTVATLLDSVWTEQSPVAARALARPDTAEYEADGVHVAFPHSFAAERAGVDGVLTRWIGRTPYADRVVFGLARAAVPARELGRDAATDYLGLALSATDYVGHRFGPLSREQLDNLIRLDRELGEFFQFLDRRVGRGRWVVGLSADHGVVTMPEWRATHGEPGFRLTRPVREQMERIAGLAAAGARPGDEQRAIVAALRNLPVVADAYTYQEIAQGAPRDSFVALFRHSYYPGRVPSDLGRLGVEVRYPEGTYPGSERGTGHGSPYAYDRVVPLILMGPGIRPQQHAAPVRTVDLAPTLAALAGVAPPGDLDGRVLPVGQR